MKNVLKKIKEVGSQGMIMEVTFYVTVEWS